MKTRPSNANAAMYIMFSSLLSPPVIRRGVFCASAFRHASTTATNALRPLRRDHRPSPPKCRVWPPGGQCSSPPPTSPSSSYASSVTLGRAAMSLYHGSDDAMVDDADVTGGGGSSATAAISEDAADDGETTKAKDEHVQGDETWKNHRSRWARRKHRKKVENLRRQQQDVGEDGDGDTAGVGLDWETFEFGTSPKMDKRFKDATTSSSDQTGIPDDMLNKIPTDSVTYQTYLQSEASIDETTSSSTLQSQSDLHSLSPELVQRSIDTLAPFVQPRRLERIDEVLGKRTRHTRFLFENPSNPSNVWACLRTLDSFGIQNVDVIVNSDSYQGKAAINQKRGMRTAMGSASWMTIRQFGSIEEAVRYLREEEGCLIYASDLNPAAKDVRDLTWDIDFDDGADGDGFGRVKRQRPICIVMGNEERGISDEMRGLADETFYLPMCGFAESFNLSVATAITLAYMSAVSGRYDEAAGSDGDGCSVEKGPLRPGDLDLDELNRLKLKGVLNSLAQKRMGKALLKKEGIVLPNSLYN